MSLPTALSTKFQQILIDKLQAEYLVLNQDMVIQSLSKNLHQYGFDHLVAGDKASEKIDFLVGLDATEHLDLPVVLSPNAIPIAVCLIPDQGQLNVLIWNVGAEHEKQYLLQQKANEVELLLEQKNKLLEQLQQTKGELELKNDQLREASRLQSAFLSGISHEFRTPLTSVTGYTNLLHVESEQQKKYVSAIVRSSQHLLSLVENLLDHGKYESNELIIFPKKNQLSDIFEDIKVLLEPLAKTKRIDFLMNCQFDDALCVYLDEVRVRQCLINLIGNAIKFTDVGYVKVDAKWQQDSLTVVVTDTGPGIEQENLDKIFLSFWQGKDTGKAGTGLGLTITNRMVELMGGNLEVESTVNEGTTMSLELTAPLIEGGDDAEAKNFDASNMRILLAEDDSDIADLLLLLLQEKGITVEYVVNGALAVDAAKQTQFDLILMDIHMPVMGGYRAVELIREFDDKVPIIVATASAVEADKAKAESIGCSGYLVKPVSVGDILKMAKQFII